MKTLSAKERTWALSGDGWTDVPDGKGETSFRYKMADGDFEYTVEGEDGRKRKVELPERRVVTYSPSLARKQKYEIDRQVEKARSLRAAAAKRSEYGDSAKYVTFSPVDGEGELRKDAKVAATLNHEAIRKARALAGYNMIVTSKTTMGPLAIYGTYHRLWRIEESFRVMKSKLDARPVYLQRQSTITGYFLVCYIAVLLMRLLQVKVLGDKFSSRDIMGALLRPRCVPHLGQEVCQHIQAQPHHRGAGVKDRASAAALQPHRRRREGDLLMHARPCCAAKGRALLPAGSAAEGPHSTISGIEKPKSDMIFIIISTEATSLSRATSARLQATQPTSGGATTRHSQPASNLLAAMHLRASDKQPLVARRLTRSTRTS
ncbi:MAG: hypothetical protein DUD39_10400 [Coriobacteriaceae bacterium]|nr:MAG: hypothetical protein DUD39_10400 [Coriobacteriaceae bacterium]